MAADSTKQVRLQKYLSDAGVASRRHAEDLILEGRVRVNGGVVDSLPAFVTPGEDEVRVDGHRVRPQRLEYFIVHKPKGVLCTNSDPAGRLRAVDLLPKLPVRLFAVGRLDEESTGLLLMTNDGELAQLISHPRYGVPKTYRAEVKGRVPDDVPERLRKGVYLSEGRARANNAEIVHTSDERSVLMLTLRESRNRQARRMLARLGYPVRTLKRVQIGPISLRGLPNGAARRLSLDEIEALREAVAAAEQEARVNPASLAVKREARRRRMEEERLKEGRGPAPRTTAPRTAPLPKAGPRTALRPREPREGGPPRRRIVE